MQVRARCVAQFHKLMQKNVLLEGIEQRIANQYAPDIACGWGVECVQVGTPPGTTGTAWQKEFNCSSDRLA